jgi:CBS domain-containing protein
MTTIEGPLIRAASVVRAALLDPRGERVGRVDDLVVRLADGHYPPVVGVRARIGGRQLFIPSDRIASIDAYSVRLKGDTVDLQPFQRREGEVLLDDDVLGRSMIDVQAGRLVHANDIALGCIDEMWRVVGVDPRRASGFHRLIPWRTRTGAISRATIIDWTDIQPFTEHVPTARLPMPLRRLRRLHPAQIADIVEEASHEEGAEIIEAIADDPDFEADVFEELNTEHQREFLDERTDEEAAEVIAEMAPDDAADLITELPADRRGHILSLLPPDRQATVRRLLSYNPETAGGLMGTDAVSVRADATVEAALAAVRAFEELAPLAGSVVVLVDAEGALVGTVALSDVVRSESGAIIGEAIEHVTARLRPTMDLPDVALMMTDYNLAALPVVDDEERVLGVVTVDDLLEAMVPPDWRRRRQGDAGD